jgi:hypothetical protein
MIPRAVLDANVLAAEVVRDFILSLAEQDCLRPMWSPELGLELQRALVRMKVAPVVADKIWQLLNEAFPFASEVDVGTAFRCAGPRSTRPTCGSDSVSRGLFSHI